MNNKNIVKEDSTVMLYGRLGYLTGAKFWTSHRAQLSPSDNRKSLSQLYTYQDMANNYSFQN